LNANGILQKHWFHVALHFIIDALLIVVAFVAAAFLRFGEEADLPLMIHWPAVVFGGGVFSAVVYIAGLYSTHSGGRGLFERAVLLLGCSILAMLVVIGGSYISSAHPLGRGVMLIGGSITFVLVLAHHAMLLHTLLATRERVVYIVSSAFEEAETRLFEDFRSHNLELIGVASACGYKPAGKAPLLGTVEEMADIVKRHRVNRVLCTHKNLNNITLTRHFCHLRYSGITVMPLIILCEEVKQYVPIELVTHEWLLNASGEPHLLYIKKVKRLFDIAASSIGLILGAPLLALAAIGIWLTSPGPILYRQERTGQFGRRFTMIKLRTMRTDAEKNGAQWSSKDATTDPRVTWLGRILRRYRIDEIPQLWHVLTGEMSFVGPRPERPEIIRELARQVPFYEERLMTQPGLTGWAQVNYPYGASAQDARRKLEYDLYYMKHMSWFLDVFIMLDTVRIVLTGGVRETTKSLGHSDAMREWERLKEVEGKPTTERADVVETTRLETRLEPI
jgi:exopolysaccharide biosynthesis polyprenyl glycosylphosphotransferase